MAPLSLPILPLSSFLSLTVQGLSSKRSVWEMMGHVLQATTSHGFRHCWTYRGTVRGFIWLLITLIHVYLLINAISNILHLLASGEVKSQTTMNGDEKMGLQLPSLVVCNRGIFSKAKLRDLQVPVNISNYLMVMTGSPFLLRRDVLSTEEGLRFLDEAYTYIQNFLQDRNFTFPELIEALSLSCEDILVQCSYGSQAYNSSDCCMFLEPMTTMLGRCYTIYLNSSFRQVKMDEYSGVSLILRDVTEHEPEILPDILDISLLAKTGLQVTLISNLTLPHYLVLTQGDVIIPGTFNTMEVFFTKTDQSGLRTLLNWQEPPCIPPSALSYQHNREALLYSSVNCQLAASFKCLSLVCPDCMLNGHYELQNNGTRQQPCGIAEAAGCMARLFTLQSSPWDRGCLQRIMDICVRVCEEQEYVHTTVVGNIPKHLLQHLNQQFQLQDQHLVSVVTVFYPAFQYRLITLYREKLLDIISNLGGVMGLFLGASLISLLEVLVFSSLACRALWGKLRRL
ncbi:sodium channel protein Nach-like [Panulirus ornatus]|uniref:sodium channel protein Nach-like n=1 Tax=Panulirus ornatus TaxID=150431 RepID=UPI003A8C7F27